MASAFLFCPSTYYIVSSVSYWDFSWGSTRNRACCRRFSPSADDVSGTSYERSNYASRNILWVNVRRLYYVNSCNIPGEAASIVTCLDGFQMAKKGRAGPALGISAFGSFIAGTLSLVGLTFIAGPLAKTALRFGPPEFTSLMVLGFLILGYMASGSMTRALMMAAFGLILGSIGVDFISGKYRFTYGFMVLEDGVGLVPSAMGLFGISEILVNIETPIKREVFKTKIRDLFPSLEDWKASFMPILRGTVLGFFLGILPGGGALISSFTSYALEKKLSKHRKNLGQES